MSPQHPGSPLHGHRVQAALLVGMAVVYTLLVIPLWDLTYLDFGDGNYLYVGQRLLDGLVPYRDILAPQPPLHLIGSAFAQAFGLAVFDSALIGARLYALLIRLAGAFLVYLIARRVFGCPLRGLVAAAVYLALPIGFWWSLCIQSENLELVFLLFAMWGVLSLDRRWMIAAGVASGLAMHCNMTALPYFLCNALFLGVRRPRLALWYIPSALGCWGIGATMAYAWAGPDYLSNVVLNQVGSFPKREILGHSPLLYFRDKIIGEGSKVLILEGALIIAGLIAMATRWRAKLATLERNSDDYRRWEYAAWYSIGMLLSIGFVMKGGTVNYIFVLGEPAVAILAADALVRLARGVRAVDLAPLRRAACAGALLLVAVFSIPAVQNVRLTLLGVQAELHVSGVEWIVDVIEATTEPGDPILAPPFYAWVTGRTVAGELAENYLWQIKYMNEVVVEQTDGEGVLKMREIAAQLRRQEIPLLLLDTRQTGRVPEIAGAVEQAYTPLDPPIVHSRHVPLLLAVPTGRAMPVLDPPPGWMLAPAE